MVNIPDPLQDAGSEAQSNFTSRRINEVMAFSATASCVALTTHIPVGALQNGAQVTRSQRNLSTTIHGGNNEVMLLCVSLRVGFKRLYAALFILTMEQPFFVMNASPTGRRCLGSVWNYEPVPKVF